MGSARISLKTTVMFTYLFALEGIRATVRNNHIVREVRALYNIDPNGLDQRERFRNIDEVGDYINTFDDIPKALRIRLGAERSSAYTEEGSIFNSEICRSFQALIALLPTVGFDVRKKVAGRKMMHQDENEVDSMLLCLKSYLSEVLFAPRDRTDCLSARQMNLLQTLVGDIVGEHGIMQDLQGNEGQRPDVLAITQNFLNNTSELLQAKSNTTDFGPLNGVISRGFDNLVNTQQLPQDSADFRECCLQNISFCCTLTAMVVSFDRFVNPMFRDENIEGRIHEIRQLICAERKPARDIISKAIEELHKDISNLAIEELTTAETTGSLAGVTQVLMEVAYSAEIYVNLSVDLLREMASKLKKYQDGSANHRWLFGNDLRNISKYGEFISDIKSQGTVAESLAELKKIYSRRNERQDFEGIMHLIEYNMKHRILKKLSGFKQGLLGRIGCYNDLKDFQDTYESWVEKNDRTMEEDSFSITKLWADAASIMLTRLFNSLVDEAIRVLNDLCKNDLLVLDTMFGNVIQQGQAGGEEPQLQDTNPNRYDFERLVAEFEETELIWPFKFDKSYYYIQDIPNFRKNLLSELRTRRANAADVTQGSRQADFDERRRISNEKGRELTERLRRKQEEREKIIRDEQERLAKEEADRKAQEEADRKAQEEADRKAQEEADRKAQEEADRKAQEEADRKAQEEADRKAQEEADRKAQEEADRKAQEDAASGGSGNQGTPNDPNASGTPPPASAPTLTNPPPSTGVEPSFFDRVKEKKLWIIGGLTGTVVIAAGIIMLRKNKNA